MAQNVIINGVTYANVPEVQIPLSGGGTARFFDTSDATAATGDILTGKTAYGASGTVQGGMANNGATGGTISTKAGSVSIPAGYTSGGSVSISSAEQSNIVAANILSGATILGVSGASVNKDTTVAAGEAAGQGQILSGFKGWVNGALVAGNLTVPTISQDATTKILSIA